MSTKTELRMPGAMLSAAQAAVIYAVMGAAYLSNGTMSGYFPAVLIPYALALYGLDLVFLRKQRPLAALALLNAVPGIALVASVLISRSPEGLTQGVMLTMLCAVVTVLPARNCLKAPGLSSLLLWVDLNAAGLVLVAAVLAINDIASGAVWCLPSAAGLLCALYGLGSLRRNRAGKLRGLTAAVLIGLLLLTLILTVWFAEPLGKGITAAWQGFGGLMTGIWNRIEQFMEALAALIPQDEFEEAASIAETGLPNTADYADSSGKAMGYLLFYILTAGVILAAIAALLVFGKNLVTKKVGAATPARQRGQAPRLWEALRRQTEELRKKWQLRRFLAENTGNSAGLYFRLEGVCRQTALARRKGETPAAFLLRLSKLDYSGEKGMPEAGFDFPLLIRETDRTLFCPGSEPAELPFARELLAAVRRKARGAGRRST